MISLAINKETCKHCSICVKICPSCIIEMKNTFPSIIEGKEDTCLKCGHCISFCPEGALDINYEGQENNFQDKALKLQKKDIALHLKSRRSIRHYKKDIVPKETIEQLLDTGRFAPTGCNIQGIHWLVIYNPQEVKKLAGLTVEWMKKAMDENNPITATLPFKVFTDAWDRGEDLICREAPHLIIAHSHKNNGIASVDGVIALTYIEVAIPSFGLGACWAGLFDIAAKFYPPLRKSLSIPEDHNSIGTLMVGYPKYEYHQIPRRNKANIIWQE